MSLKSHMPRSQPRDDALAQALQLLKDPSLDSAADGWAELDLPDQEAVEAAAFLLLLGPDQQPGQ